jgi:hypothetical protein
MTEMVTIALARVDCMISDTGDLTLDITATRGKTHFTIHNGKVVSGRIPWKSLGEGAE